MADNLLHEPADVYTVFGPTAASLFDMPIDSSGAEL